MPVLTIKAPTKDELRFLKMLLSGKSTRGAARELDIPQRSAYNMAEKLTYLGFIRPILGDIRRRFHRYRFEDLPPKTREAVIQIRGYEESCSDPARDPDNSEDDG